ncbi:hypothetical protein IHN63_00455 [Deinococcus sp. 6YEL10]|uniref:hypothetical protein n=1 Tax=Deinococcus sp. 6YEL10 TaxID=2745870 RepID=UPI001E621A3A|nr:hypothetical protein [Deinococcus sp. 6YEL10]MCD0159770.1 hypothetical protein [Deinococcus sp. 6YEL10]
MSTRVDPSATTTVNVSDLDDLWTAILRSRQMGSNPYADKLTLSLNEDIEDVFRLSNNYQVIRDRKTGQPQLRGQTFISTKARRVKIKGLGVVSLPALRGGFFMNRQGRPALKIPIIGYDWQIGDDFDAEKALKGARSFATKIVNSNFSLVQNAIFPKKTRKMVDDWIKDLPPALRGPVRSFASQLERHGTSAIKKIIVAAVTGDAKQIGQLLTPEIEALQKDLKGFAERAGSGALTQLARSITDSLEEQTGIKTRVSVKVKLDSNAKEPWQLAKIVTRAGLGIEVPYGDDAVVRLNTVIEDVFNLANNTPSRTVTASMNADDLQDITTRLAQSPEESQTGDETVSKLSFTLDPK